MQYTYFPLQHPDNLRLLRVWPYHHYEDEKCVHVSIFEYTRSEAPAYTALSYVWGSQTELVEVKIVGGSKLIILNLGRALVELEKDAFELELDNLPPQFFWIDALCINQADDTEKSHQVGRMKDVYANADEVVAFLGPAQPAESFVSVVFDLCREYERSFQETDWFDREATFRARRLSDAEDETLQWVFNRIYFMRVWVLQEFAVCDKTTVRCGRHSMDVETFQFATIWLWRGFSPHYLIGLRKGHARVLNVFHVRSTVRDGDQNVSLLDVLVTGRETSASDPRDKVFGLVGLLDNELVSASIRPDYSKTVQKVYIDMAKHIIQTTNDLAVFCYAGLGNSQISELPSWVPDWSATRKKDGVIDYVSKATFTDETIVQSSPWEKAYFDY